MKQTINQQLFFLFRIEFPETPDQEPIPAHGSPPRPVRRVRGLL